MKWLLALSAALMRLSRFASPDHTAPCPQTSAGGYPTARRMNLMQSQDVTALLTRRAMSLHNRDRSGAERYLRLHRILSRKDCSND
jgi:hypothetical protein